MSKRRATVRHGSKAVKPAPARRSGAPARAPRVLVVGPNSAIDEVFRTNGFCPLGGARARRSLAFAGGKAANAAHAAALEGADVTVVAFAGGARGREFARLLRARGVRGALVPTRAQTRRTFCFLDADGADPVLVVEDGERVSRAEVDALERLALARLARADVLVIAGSVPPGMRPSAYARLIRAAKQRGVPVVVDAHGEALRAAAAAAPTAIVPNERELAQLHASIQQQGLDDATVLELAASHLHAGVHAVVVKQDERGLICVERGEAHRVVGLPRVGNATGSGDVITAHVALALARRWPVILALPRAVAAAGANLAHDEPAHYREREVRELLATVEVRPIPTPAVGPHRSPALSLPPTPSRPSGMG